MTLSQLKRGLSLSHDTVHLTKVVYLQHDGQDVRMGFFNFIKQDHGVWTLAQGIS